MSSSTSALALSSDAVGNKVKIYCKGPYSFIEGTVQGCDAYGTIILSNAKETLLSDQGEPITPEALYRQQRRALKKQGVAGANAAGDAAAGNTSSEKERDEQISDDEQDEQQINRYKPITSTERNPLQLILADRVASIELHSVGSTGSVQNATGARPVRTVFADCLPRKRLFVCDVDTLLGRAICNKFGDSRDWEIVGTKCGTKSTADDETPVSCGAVVPSFRQDAIAFKTAVLRADVVVCPLRDDVHDAQAALRILSNTVFENEKVFILVSSVLTWAATADAIKAKAAADAKAENEEARKQRIEAGEDPDEDDDGEDDDEEDQNQSARNLPAASDEHEEQEPPPVFSDANDHERVPHARYQHWRLLEQATKFANSESLHTYVLMAGMLYGDGEEALADIFNAAWHREPLPICLPLQGNVIPAIHVRDLATGIFNASNAEEVQSTRYMLAVDSGNNTWSEMITALSKVMGDPNLEPALVQKPLGGASRWFDYISLDLRLEASNFASLIITDDEWVSQAGIVANMDKIAKEFRKKHALTPLRIAIVGPPASGKSSLAKWIADAYGVEYIDVPEIIAYYKKHRQQVFEKLIAHREMKKEEAQRRAEADENADEEEAIGGGAADDGSGSVASGNTSVTSSARNLLPTAGGGRRGRKSGGKYSIAGLVDVTALTQGDVDLEDFEFVNEDGDEDDFEVKFSSKTPPPGAAPSRMTNSNDGDNTEDPDNSSRPPSSRRGGPADMLVDDDDDGDEARARNKALVPPEVEAAEDKDDDEDDDEALQLLKDQLRLCNKVLALRNPKDGRFIDHALAVMARYKILHSAQGKNQGYILDGFPKTTRQAAFTFSADADTSDVSASLPDFDEDGNLPDDVLAPVDPDQDDDRELQSLMEAVDPEMMLDFAIVLDASDTVVVSRASLHGGDVNGALSRIYRRLAFHQKYNSRGGKPGVSVQSWLRAILTNADNGVTRSVAVMELNTDNYWPVAGSAAVSQVKKFLGVPHVIHPTVHELEQAQADAAVAALQEKQERAEADAERKQRRSADDAERKATAASHSRRLATSSDEKQAATAVCAIPAQSYLTEFIAAPLATCVADVARVRPNDPLNVLADSLYQYEAPIVKAKEILTGRGSHSNIPRH